MGVLSTVKVRNGGSLAKGKGVGREAESEGSRRQTHGPRYTNGIWGRVGRMSCLSITKSQAAKGQPCKLQWSRAERWRSCPGRPAEYAKSLRNRNREVALNPQESAEVIVREYWT